jgi:ABC-type uncharacterized transport system substrate-binding protein
MNRRAFITLLGGAISTWPLAARAQQPDRVRRIAVLMGLAEDDPETKARLAAFRQGLEKRGWSEGRNVRIDTRFAPAGTQAQVLAKELVALQPDVIFTHSTPLVAALQGESLTMPIVFAAVADPSGSGFVASLARPGGNITGVIQYEATVTGKWLAMLKEIAPSLERAACVVNPETATYYHYYLRAAEAVAPSLAIDVVLSPVKNAADIERAIQSFASVPNGGLVVMPDITPLIHRNLIIALAARHRMPAVYYSRRGRRADVLRKRRGRHVPAGGILCRPHPARRQARRPSGAGGSQIRNGSQSPDGEGARPDRAARLARGRRRSDRVM